MWREEKKGKGRREREGMNPFHRGSGAEFKVELLLTLFPFVLFEVDFYLTIIPFCTSEFFNILLLLRSLLLRITDIFI